MENEYRRKKFYDPNIDRKNKIYNDAFKILDKGVPMPSIIEVSNSGICNRKCSFVLEVIQIINMHMNFFNNYTINL